MPDAPQVKIQPHPFRAERAEGRPARRTAQVEYVELGVTTNFTFLMGASHPEEMVERAAQLGHAKSCCEP
jgi:hypothetical protein